MDFRDVEFRYAWRPEILALGGVSLSLQPGRMVALVGLSGSGKSTLVSLLQRLYDPTAGRVRGSGSGSGARVLAQVTDGVNPKSHSYPCPVVGEGAHLFPRFICQPRPCVMIDLAMTGCFTLSRFRHV